MKIIKKCAYRSPYESDGRGKARRVIQPVGGPHIKRRLELKHHSWHVRWTLTPLANNRLNNLHFTR